MMRPNQQQLKKKNASLMVSLFCVVAGMVMLAYASVPLYRLFCQVTGYGGTPTISAASPEHIINRNITVSFNADVDKNLPWTFRPLVRELNVKVGERQLAIFEATNTSSTDIVGTSTFNVTPFKVGSHFVKLECFCFEKQRINSGETVSFPVSFYISPEIEEDENLDDITNITLSYTFFALKE
jgi:cytochrome c oxidase assembly protein subunit 11